MLTPEQKKLLAEEAERTLRLSWGDSDPQMLGQLVATIKTRLAESPVSFPDFAEFVKAAVRTAHAENIKQRDGRLDALLNHEVELKRTLLAIHNKQGPEGVVSFAQCHQIELSDCSALLEAEGESLDLDASPDLEIGD